MFLTIFLRPILLGLIFQGLIKPRVGDVHQRHFPIIFHQIIGTRQSCRKFLTRALRLVTQEGDVETHHYPPHPYGSLFIPYPRCPTWPCAISKPYQTHIRPIYGSPPFQKLDFGLLRPRFLRGFPSPCARDPFFHTAQRFALPNHVISHCMSPRSLFPLVSGFPP